MPQLLRGISENGGVIFYGIDSTDIVKKAEQTHKTSATATAALGRLLTAAALMSATLKSTQDSLTLRVNGGGSAGTVLAVANGNGDIKGYIANPLADAELRADGKLNVGGIVGTKGTLSVIKDIGMKEPYVGQIPLVSGEIAEDITSYYATSEQTPTVCALGVLVDKDLSVVTAGGYLVQLLPGATDEEISILENNLAKMQSITHLYANKSTTWQICEMLLEGFNPNVLDEETINYKCDCSKARVERAIISIGKSELEEMISENPDAETVCHFCNTKYQVDLTKLLKSL